MAQFTEYVTKQDERWDTVAYKAYGDALDYERIVVANPRVALHRIIPAGTRLRIPVIERSDVLTDEESLPPWER